MIENTAACSIVMVSYHTGPVLFHAIEAARKEGDVILVDNGNPPEVVERLRALPLTLLSGHGNIGFARGCNLGAEAAKGEYLLLLNPDCLLAPDAVAETVAALKTFPGAMLAGGAVLNADGTPQRGSRRQLLTPRTAIAEALRLPRMKRFNAHQEVIPRNAHEVPAVSGAYMCLKTSDYRALGGMDEHYFLHVEDLDFCQRVHKAGGKIIYVPSARAIHLLSTSGASSLFVEKHKARGFTRYFHTHFPDTQKPLLWALGMAGWGRCYLRAMLSRFRGKSDAASLLLMQVLETRRLTSLPAGGRLGGGHSSAMTEQVSPHPDLPPMGEGAKVLVTGATSQIGGFVIGRLLAAGANVTAVTRGQGLPLALPNLTWLSADIDTADFSLSPHTHAIHCAPLWALPKALPAMKAAGIRHVAAFGSTSLFGKADSRDAGEREVVRKLAQAEKESREAAEAFNIALTVLRPTLIYGAGRDGNVTRIARTIRRFGFFPFSPPALGKRQPVHADDLARAAIAVLERGAVGEYNLSGGETLSYHAMVERIFAALGKKPRLLPVPFFASLLDVAGKLFHKSHVTGDMARRMQEDLVFPHEAAARDFGYAPRPFLCGGIKDINGETV